MEYFFLQISIKAAHQTHLNIILATFSQLATSTTLIAFSDVLLSHYPIALVTPSCPSPLKPPRAAIYRLVSTSHSPQQGKRVRSTQPILKHQSNLTFSDDLLRGCRGLCPVASPGSISPTVLIFRCTFVIVVSPFPQLSHLKGTCCEVSSRHVERFIMSHLESCSTSGLDRRW